MKTTQRISLDFAHRGITPRIAAVQGDGYTREVELSLYSGGQAWTIPDGVSARMRYRLPDGTGDAYDILPDGSTFWTASENILTAVLAPQMLVLAGLVEAQIQIDLGDETIATFSFIVVVERDPSAGVPESKEAVSWANWTKTELNRIVEESKANGGFGETGGNTGSPQSTVQSVNGKTGAVSLTASDVGARPESWTPTAQEVGALPSTYTPPNQTAQQVGADPAGTAVSAVGAHNVDTDAHNDLRLELRALADRINAALDSDDDTMDQLSEIVAYIKSHADLIQSVTTSKVNVADIVNDLVTNVANKPLSAAQGVALKSLIDSLSGGKLDASKLTEAIDTALAQAKESGKFDGDDGITPHIGDNGNWFIGDTDTGTQAKGSDGKTAYQYARDGGYTGTEAEFSAKLAREHTINPLYGKKVSFLGDSICAGSSESTSYLGGYGKIIADRNNMVYENVAHAGATVTAETYSRSTGNAKPWLCRMVENMSADADYAIIEGGINDGWDETVKNNVGAITIGYNAELDDTTYYGAFESMLKQLVTRFQGKKIGYIAVPKIHSLYDSSQNIPNCYHIALECCAKWGVSVCDLNTITPPVEYLSKLGTEYTADACHPTYEGYLKYYCDPIEAWMKTLITSGGNNNASVSPEVISEITSKITALDTGKLSNAGVSFRKALLPLADGTTIEIDVLTAVDGTLVVKYVNRVPISIDTDGTVYGVDYDEDGTKDGYKKACRLSASSGSEKEAPDASLIGFVPVKAGDIVQFKYIGTNTCWDTYPLDEAYNVIAYYDSAFGWLGSICPLQSNGVAYGICTAADASTGSVADGGIVSFTVPSNISIAYLRLSIAIDANGDMGLDKLIVTVNEEIV